MSEIPISQDHINASCLPRTRSGVWHHFDVLRETVGTKTKLVAKCKYCANVSYSEGRNGSISTGNLRYHVERKHPEHVEDYERSKVYSSAIDNARNKLIRWIVLKDIPFDEVEALSFRNFVGSIDPNSSVVSNSVMLSAKTVRTYILQAYEEQLPIIKKLCETMDGQVAFTMDLWTSTNRVAFMGVTAHWIETHWVMRSITLGFIHVSGRHTGVNICDVFLDLIKDRNIRNVFALTMDNASNNDTFSRELEERCAVLGYRYTTQCRIRCFAHVLNLGVKVILDQLKSNPKYQTEEEYGSDEDDFVNSPEDVSIGKAVAKIRSVVVQIRLSVLKEEKLHQLNKTFGIDDLNLVLDVKHRWNSTYDMLRRALILKQSIQSLMRSEKELHKYNLTDAEWELIKEFLNILKNKLKIVIDTAVGPLKEACCLARNKLEAYAEESNVEAQWIAIVVDPTLKLDFFKENYDKTTVKNIKSAALDVFNKYYEINTNHSAYPTYSSGSCSAELTNQMLAIYPKRPRKQAKGSEILLYLKDELAPPNTDVLEWWKINEQKYPNVAKMARDYLAIQGSSVPAERIFSKGANLVSPKRGSLKPETISAVMSLKSWWASDLDAFCK